MPGKRPIDIQRDAAITLRIGGDDQSPATDFLSTGTSLYAIKEKGVYKIQLADDIDPGRTNPKIDNLNQQVLTEGSSNEIVARILLTAKYLFDERNATVKPFVANLFEHCLVLTRQVLELGAMTRGLVDEISEKEKALTEKPAAKNAFILPSVPELDTKMRNILSQADKAKTTILMICQLQFIPGAEGQPELKKLDKAAEAAFSAEAELVTAWKEMNGFFRLVREMRNASEHPKDNYRVALTDFSMWPSGEVHPPLMEVQHHEMPIRTLPVIEFLEFIRTVVLDHAEMILVLVRYASLLSHNPFGEWVAEFPKEERHHKFVRYYRAINADGRWRILG